MTCAEQQITFRKIQKFPSCQALSYHLIRSRSKRQEEVRFVLRTIFKVGTEFIGKNHVIRKCQDNAWINKNCVEEWFFQQLAPHVEFFKLKHLPRQADLILDNATTHLNTQFIQDKGQRNKGNLSTTKRNFSDSPYIDQVFCQLWRKDIDVSYLHRQY